MPTIGRRSLDALLHSLASQAKRPRAIVLVDDRPVPDPPLAVPDELALDTTVLQSRGRGPAAARNLGWKAATTSWVVFLDDDVVPMPSWSERLAADLAAPTDVAATQAEIVVPRPADRRLTDQERNVAALEHAGWITADLAVRRDALVQLRGFDERFPRAYREDSDFAMRAGASGWRFVHGSRTTHHPLRSGPWWASVPAQRGNRDDALMRALHGRRWTSHRGRRRRHVAITVAAGVALGGRRDGPPASRRGVRSGVGRRNDGVRRHSHRGRPARAGGGRGTRRHERCHSPGRHLVVAGGPHSMACRQGPCMGRWAYDATDGLDDAATPGCINQTVMARDELESAPVA